MVLAEEERRGVFIGFYPNGENGRKKTKKTEKTPRQAGEKTGENLNRFLQSMVFAEEERRGVFIVFLT